MPDRQNMRHGIILTHFGGPPTAVKSFTGKRFNNIIRFVAGKMVREFAKAIIKQHTMACTENMLVAII
jgi:hypothetical protein